MDKLEKNHLRDAECCSKCIYSNPINLDLLLYCANDKNFNKKDINRRVCITSICDLYKGEDD